MTSARFGLLRTQLADLRRHLLPSRFSGTGFYNNADRVSVRALGYRILCAAEIENFLEDRCVEIAQTALASWISQGHHSKALLSVALFSGIKLEKPPPYLNPLPKDQKDWDDLVSPRKRVDRAVSEYVNFASRDNNGIREKNLLALLQPVGVDLRTLDPLLIGRLDDLGSRRGAAAHLSISRAVRTGVDPANELAEIKHILAGLAAVDALLDGLLADASPPAG